MSGDQQEGAEKKRLQQELLQRMLLTEDGDRPSLWEDEDEDEGVIAECSQSENEKMPLHAPSVTAKGTSDTESQRAESVRVGDGNRGRRRVSVGWMKDMDDGLKITLAGLIASLALNPERQVGGISMEDRAWFNSFVKKLIVSFLELSEEISQGILPLGMSGADAQPLVDTWKDRVSEEDRERAFGELFAQSILEIGSSDASCGRHYDSRTHWCLHRVGIRLQVSEDCMEEYEEMIAGLITSAAAPSKGGSELDEDDTREKSRSRLIRNFKVGTAAIVGAALVGVTGGLALPAIGASLATFGGAAAATGAFMASAGGTALFTTLFTAGGLGLTGYKMNRRIGSSLKEFEFEEIPKPGTDESFPTGLHVCICVSGSYRSKKSKLAQKRNTGRDGSVHGGSSSTQQRDQGTEMTPMDPPSEELDEFATLEDSNEWSRACLENRGVLGEPYQLVWETEILKGVSNALQQFALNQAIGKAVSETLKVTTFAAVMAAVAWPNFLLSATSFIDNPWAVAVNRAKLAGEELARAILSGAHGYRPVTLVGYSLGGLVIFHCLEYLAKKKNSRFASAQIDGLLLDVIILGAPITASKTQWEAVRSIVGGSLVNGYSPNDWVLAVLYRASTLTVSQIAGLYRVPASGVLNIDLSDHGLVGSQFDYPKKITQCTALAMEQIRKRL